MKIPAWLLWMVPFLINSIINNFPLVAQRQKVSMAKSNMLTAQPSMESSATFFIEQWKLSFYVEAVFYHILSDDDYNKQCTKENDDEKNNIKCSLEGLTPRKKGEEVRRKSLWCKIYAQLNLEKLKRERKTPQGVEGKVFVQTSLSLLP